MRWLIIILFTLIAAVGGFLYFVDYESPDKAIFMTEDERFLRQNSDAFMEDITFKDFDQSASYHRIADRQNLDIAKLIERLFLVKPELLDIQKYEILWVKFDRSKNRARVKVKSVIKILNSDRIEEPEFILYWFKDPREGWIMELESSIR